MLPTVDGHQDQALYLCKLGTALTYRFHQLGQVTDISDAIISLEGSASLFADGDPGKNGCLNKLGNAFSYRFLWMGNNSDLDKAISAWENAVELTPASQPEKVLYLFNLGFSCQSRFGMMGEISDLQKATTVFEQMIELTPAGHPQKAMYFSNLGDAFKIVFERLGKTSDLEKAVSAYGNAVEQAQTGHSDKAKHLSDLGVSLQVLFDKLGEISDLEKAISVLDNAVELTPTSHPEKATYLGNLGHSLQIKFEYLGEISDLEKAISAKENAAELTPTGHPNKAIHLSNLAISFQSRFQRLGELSDSQKAISLFEHAVELTPIGHQAKAVCLSNLGTSFQILFERLGEISDLEKAISILENVLELTPSGHPNKAGILTNLGNSYENRFMILGEIPDLEKAISARKSALELTPADHHQAKAVFLSNLSSSFQCLFERQREISDLENAISTMERAVELTPIGHPNKAMYLNQLGSSHLFHFEKLGKTLALEKAIHCFSQASQSSTSPPVVCFIGAELLIKATKMAGLSSLEAYKNALHLLPHVAWIGLPILNRYGLLSRISIVVHDASAAISFGHYEMALEWLEQGRSIVWGQLLQLRTPVDELLVNKPELAAQLLAVSQALDKASAREANLESSLSAEQIAQNHHLLALQWDKLIQEVHLVPGFEQFLSPKAVSQLIPAAKLGLVIVISIHKAGCHALALQSTSDRAKYSPLDGPSPKNHLQSFQQTPNAHNLPLNTTLVHIPLPNFSYEKAHSLQLVLKGLCSSRYSREVVFDHDNQPPQSTFEEMLSDLWILIVLPILDGLGLLVSGNDNLPHIWWCPTGPLAFLPIHAAGLYNTEEPGHKLSEFAVSSYTPTITALLNTQHTSPPPTIKILAIAQESNHGQFHLPNTNTEVENLKKHAGLINFKTLKGEQATVDNVINGMSESTWVHLACHGTQNPSDPTKSAFILADGDLKLSRINKMTLPHAEFAFLSACQTAAGDVTLQEEAVHLAAGMLMAGYKSVIATMWAIRDADGPLVANDVYAEILRNGQPDYTRAAYALHHAAQKLRRRGAPFISWVPFIHLGR